MKHKHSPNFIENEREAYESKNNPVSTFFWTVVTVTLFLLGFSLTGCGDITSAAKDTQMLQSKYLKVYPISETRYIVFDSLNVYDVRVGLEGQITSTIKIN